MLVGWGTERERDKPVPPASARPSARVRPRPRPPPVTMKTLPLRSKRLRACLGGGGVVRRGVDWEKLRRVVGERGFAAMDGMRGADTDPVLAGDRNEMVAPASF